jgi:CDP-paratose 2-epimerase
MRILIIGGAGFIGINSAYYFLDNGDDVVIFDNLSRPGSLYNLQQLRSKYQVGFIEGDIRDYNLLSRVIAEQQDFDSVLLLAGQVAVTTSVTNPRLDFEINALGTFNVLEALRENNKKPLLIYSSTNKVYGKMENVEIVKNGDRYEYANLKTGIDENFLLDFYSPYGCSKGCGEQYVRDYSRMYDIPTVVFRQSCIYGPNQFGIEDQGWVAWFTIATLLNKQFSIYGDGNQIRDVLFVGDLVELYHKAMLNSESCIGKIYNVGGGPNNTLALNELIRVLELRFQTKLSPKFGDWRPGDQKVYVSDISSIFRDLNWAPSTDINHGIEEMAAWIESNIEILNHYVFGE